MYHIRAQPSKSCKLHDEQRNESNGLIDETPLIDAVEGAKPLPLRQITSDNLGQKFISPKPAERQQTAPDTVWIRYHVPVEDYDAVQKYFEVEKAGEVGSKTFNYFYTREIED